jgi:hypothetical protein
MAASRVRIDNRGCVRTALSGVRARWDVLRSNQTASRRRAVATSSSVETKATPMCSEFKPRKARAAASAICSTRRRDFRRGSLRRRRTLELGIDDRHLDRDVGLDVRLAEEPEHPAAGHPLDLFLGPTTAAVGPVGIGFAWWRTGRARRRACPNRGPRRPVKRVRRCGAFRERLCKRASALLPESRDKPLVLSRTNPRRDPLWQGELTATC